MAIYSLEYLQRIEKIHQTTREMRPGVWVPARPADESRWRRLRAAWAVLRGDADAFIWPYVQRDHL